MGGAVPPPASVMCSAADVSSPPADATEHVSLARLTLLRPEIAL
jgi:hypothetical protein